jgi:hypothetical protein
MSRYVAPVKEIRKYVEFLLLKVADKSFGTINRGWKYSIENDYNAFAALQFHSVNSAHLNITVTVAFSRRNISEI